LNDKEEAVNAVDTAYDLARTHKLAAQQRAQLLALAAPMPQAGSMRTWFWRVVTASAAALGGFGVILWVAANWEDFGRWGRFALLQISILVFCLGAAWLLARKARTQAPKKAMAAASMGLVAMLCTGALFAYFGQTYQTGADPWQLFALWAALTLPLCLALRSDVLWAPWGLVAITGISLWLQAYSQHSWRFEANNFPVYAMAATMGVAVATVLGPLLRRYTGAGVWSFRLVVTLNVLGLTAGGVAALFDSNVQPQYLLALVLLAAGFVLWLQPKSFDVYALSAAALGLVVLLVGGLAHLLARGGTSDLGGSFFLLAIAAGGLLTVATKLILTAQKNQTMQQGGQT
jgi:uncharacterized membrane protein